MYFFFGNQFEIKVKAKAERKRSPELKVPRVYDSGSDSGLRLRIRIRVSEGSIGKLTDPSLHSASLRMTGLFPNVSTLISTLTFSCLDFKRSSLICGRSIPNT